MQYRKIENIVIGAIFYLMMFFVTPLLAQAQTTFSAMDITGDTGSSLGSIFFDVDGDLDLDLYVANNLGQQNRLWINDGSGDFTANDITGDLGNSVGPSFGDVDGDLDLDLYVPNDFEEQNHLWINDGSGNFTANDITGDLGYSRDSVILDVDDDDDLDIYVANRASGTKQNRLWINDGSGNFTANDITGDLFDSRSPSFADVDNDDDLDIYVTNATDQQNKLWMNNINLNSDVISITNLSQYQIFQRDGNQSDIPVSGTYTGTCTSIEARFNGASYSTIDASPSGGTFSGLLINQPVGQGSVDVRCSNNFEVDDSVNDIGIGDVFIIAGQSNAMGRATNAQIYTHPTLKAVVFNENDLWLEANDPIDIDTNIGSPWPLVATEIMQSQNIPVGFLSTAQGGTGLVNPDDWLVPTGTLYLNMLQQVSDSEINAFKGVYWHQGENDINNSVTQLDYNTELDNLAAAIQTNVPGAPPMIVARVGYKTTSSPSREDLDAIREAQSEAWFDNDNIFEGPTLNDIGPLADGVHFQTNEEVQTLATRWWAATEAAFYGGSTGQGPQFVEAIEDVTRYRIYITYDNVIGTLSPSTGITGFRVEDDGIGVGISTIEVISDDTVQITLDLPLSGTATISYGSGNDIGNLSDENEYNLPSESFVDESVNLYVDTVPPTITLTGTTPVNVNQNDTYTDAGATCTDDIDPTCTVTTVNPVDTAIPGTYTVTYDAQDAAGNNATQVTRTVTVTAVQASRSGFRAYSPAQAALLFARARGETTTEPTHPCTINYTRLITRGSRGNDVRQVQSCMNTLGYTSGPEDGIYGPLTYAGVTAYQRAKNLRYIDGIVGPETSAALNRL